jgi:hypothetical protein
MQRHKKIYLDFFGYGLDDFIPCEVKGCTRKAVDVHHIDNRGMGGSDLLDYIENLAGLCREHHNQAEDDPEFNEKVRAWHLKRVEFVRCFLN